MPDRKHRAGCRHLSPHSVHVQESVHDDFAQKVAEHMEAVRVGDGLDSSTTMGPCINQSQADHAQAHVDDAKEKGAQVLCGGSRPANLDKGFFMSPTLLGNAMRNMRVYQEETFAPVIPLFKCAPAYL